MSDYSALVKGALSTGLGLLMFLCFLAILTGLFYLLHQYFIHNAEIKKIYRFLIYLLTMCAVGALLLGWLIGIILPVVPGFVFLLLALILLRRHYKHPWIEEKLGQLHLLRKK